MIRASKIESVGTYIPEQVVTTSSIVDRLKLPRPLKLELMTGIRERRHCGQNEDSLVLAQLAARDCLQNSAIMPDQVEMVIICSITRYVNGLRFVNEPSLSLMLKQNLGLDRAMAFDISNACAGMLTGIHIANDFIQRGEVDNCLVVSGEFITRLSDNAIENIRAPHSPEIASLTLGDAGGAIMLCETTSTKEKILVSKFVTLGDYSEMCLGYLTERQPGGIMVTKMKQIHDASIKHAPSIIEEALSEAGLSLKEIDCLIPHQTSRQAIKAGREHFEAYFGEMAQEVITNLEKLGNTASTSHSLAIHMLLKEQRLKRGSNVMLLSFASGLVIGVVIFTVHDLIENYGFDH